MVLLRLVDLCCGSLLKGPKRLWRLGQGCHPGTAGSPPAPRARAHSTPSWMKSPALRACSIPPAWIAGLPEVMNILALDNNALNGSLPASWDLPASVSWLYLHNNSFGGASGALVSKQLVLAARGAEPAKCRPLWCGVSAHRAPKMLRRLRPALRACCAACGAPVGCCNTRPALFQPTAGTLPTWNGSQASVTVKPGNPGLCGPVSVPSQPQWETYERSVSDWVRLPGGSLPDCSALAASPSPGPEGGYGGQAPSPEPAAPPPPPGGSGGGGSSTGAIVGGVLGACAAVAGALALWWWCSRRRRRAGTAGSDAPGSGSSGECHLKCHLVPLAVNQSSGRGTWGPGTRGLLQTCVPGGVSVGRQPGAAGSSAAACIRGAGGFPSLFGRMPSDPPPCLARCAMKFGEHTCPCWARCAADLKDLERAQGPQDSANGASAAASSAKATGGSGAGGG